MLLGAGVMYSSITLGSIYPGASSPFPSRHILFSNYSITISLLVKLLYLNRQVGSVLFVTK